MMLIPLVLSLALTQDRQPVKTSSDVLSTYEIRDLLPKLPGEDTATELDSQIAKELARQRGAAIDFLSTILAQEVQPPAKSSQWMLRITPSGTLVLHATPEQHDWARAFLERIRHQEPRVQFDTTWIEGPKGAYHKMGLPEGSSASVIDAKERERLLALGKDDPRFEVLQRPSLTLNPLAVGTLSVGQQLSYVKNYKLETVQPGDAKIADPQIETVLEGLELQPIALVLDGGKIALDIAASTTTVRRPIPTKTLRLSPDYPTEVTVAMPEIDRKSVQARCTLAPEGTVAFCVPVAGKEDREMLILSRARAAPAAGSVLPR